VYRQAQSFEKAIGSARQALEMRQAHGWELAAIDDLATLALIALDIQDLPSAPTSAQQALTALNACQGAGPEFPQRDYWACYRVFETLGQTEEARAALQAAYDLVMARAMRIADPEVRRSFLENAPRNRQVMDDARRVLGVND
jgi:hypothetical protein